MQTSMLLQSSTCSTTPPSTCSEVRRGAQKACGDILQRKPCSAGNVASARVDRVARDAAGEWRLDRQTVDCCPGADQWWKQGLSENHFLRNFNLA